MTTIMQDIQHFAPPSLMLPTIESSVSAPQSRLPSPPKLTKKRQSYSLPVSPKAKQLSPINKSKALAPIRRSPTRALKKHVYAATFVSHNPRAKSQEAPCPVHSYSTIEQAIANKPSKYSVGGVKFSDVPRDVMEPTRVVCPVHVYQEAKSTLSQLGSASFARYAEPSRADKCPVHAYATPPSSMRQRPATFAKAATPRVADVASSSPAVHAYSEPRSTLLSKGSALFSTSRQSRDAFQGTDRALAPVHSYLELRSTLKSMGGTTFGSTPRSSFLGAGGLSRTGLIVAVQAEAAEKSGRWNALKPLPRLLPKLLPLLETDANQSSAKAWADADESGSPREVEACLEALERPQSPA